MSGSTGASGESRPASGGGASGALRDAESLGETISRMLSASSDRVSASADDDDDADTIQGYAARLASEAKRRGRAVDDDVDVTTISASSVDEMLEQARDQAEISPRSRRDVTVVMLVQAFGGKGDQTFEVKFVMGNGGEVEVQEGEGAGGLHGLLSKFISGAGGDASGEDDADEDE